IEPAAITMPIAPRAPGQAAPPPSIAPPAASAPHVVAPPDAKPAGDRRALDAEIRELEKQRIVEALDKCAGNQSRAAKMLGMPRRSLLRRIEEYGIARPRKGREADEED